MLAAIQAPINVLTDKIDGMEGPLRWRELRPTNCSIISSGKSV